MIITSENSFFPGIPQSTINHPKFKEHWFGYTNWSILKSVCYIRFECDNIEFRHSPDTFFILYGVDYNRAYIRPIGENGILGAECTIGKSDRTLEDQMLQKTTFNPTFPLRKGKSYKTTLDILLERYDNNGELKTSKEGKTQLTNSILAIGTKVILFDTFYHYDAHYLFKDENDRIYQINRSSMSHLDISSV
jgi:hypothetical protein